MVHDYGYHLMYEFSDGMMYDPDGHISCIELLNYRDYFLMLSGLLMLCLLYVQWGKPLEASTKI